MSKFSYQNENYVWTRATTKDITDMLMLSENNYLNELNDLYEYNREIFQYTLTQGILTQEYFVQSQLIVVARDKTTNKLLCWAMATNNNTISFSKETSLEVKFIHTELNLPKRTLMKLIVQCLEMFILFQHHNNIPMLVSSSMRVDQHTFMKIHEKLNFKVRGSVAYRRLQNAI